MSATTLRLPEAKLRALRVVSSLMNRPMSKIIEELVDGFLEDYYDLKEAEEVRREEGTIPWEIVKKELGL